jgi:hypothetical protein
MIGASNLYKENAAPADTVDPEAMAKPAARVQTVALLPKSNLPNLKPALSDIDSRISNLQAFLAHAKATEQT